MIITTEMRQEDFYQNASIEMNVKFLESLGEHKALFFPEYSMLDGKIPQVFHSTRQVEYPWAVKVCPPKGRVLDIGSNPQFPIVLMNSDNDLESITIHHTEQDLPYLSMVYTGSWHTCAPVLTALKDRWNMVVGHPGNWPIPECYYDVIYNISVMEHLPPDLALEWLKHIWRVLKPGGKLVMTCDHAHEGEGYGFWNHNYRAFFDAVGAVITEDEGVPWNGHLEAAKNSVIELSGAVEAIEGRSVSLAVFGFVAEKP